VFAQQSLQPTLSHQLLGALPQCPYTLRLCSLYLLLARGQSSSNNPSSVFVEMPNGSVCVRRLRVRGGSRQVDRRDLALPTENMRITRWWWWWWEARRRIYRVDTLCKTGDRQNATLSGHCRTSALRARRHRKH